MTTRSKLDEIEDFHFAVDKFIHHGKSIDEVTEMLQQRGADTKQIDSIFEVIGQNYKGAQLLETGKSIRALNFVIDFSVICTLFYLIFSALSKDDWLSYSLLIVLVIPLTYFIFLELFLGQTLGKFITGSIVVDIDGKIPSFLKILIRTAYRFSPHTLFSAFFRDRISHDEASGTYVVNKKRWTTKYEIT